MLLKLSPLKNYLSGIYFLFVKCHILGEPISRPHQHRLWDLFTIFLMFLHMTASCKRVLVFWPGAAAATVSCSATASVSLRPSRSVCTAAARVGDKAVILFSLGGWRKGRRRRGDEGEVQEEGRPGRNEVIANCGSGRTGGAEKGVGMVWLGERKRITLVECLDER